MKITGFLFGLTIVTVVTGCVNQMAGRPEHGYLKEGENVFGRASALSASEKARLIDSSVQRLLTDPMFSELYDLAKARADAAGAKRPILVVKPIENNTGDGRSDSDATGQMYRDLLTGIRKTGLFTLRDRLTEKAVIEDVLSGNDNGESADVAGAFGAYSAPDFVLTGQLRRDVDVDDGVNIYTYSLNLQMTDTRTKDIFWSDTIPFPSKY